MCTCASCEYTDSYAGYPDLFGEQNDGPKRGETNGRMLPGFPAWPRGNPAGAASSAKEYKAHAKHCGADGLPKPHVFKTGQPPKFNTYGLVMPIAPAPKWLHDWINRKEASPTEAEPARPDQPGKADPHLPELDRQREPAVIYAMPKKTEQKRPRGRPALPGRKVLIKLTEAQIKRAAKLGGDNVAAGIRKALSG